jgi:acetoin utilization deacetylase AcuC-like enzyme
MPIEIFYPSRIESILHKGRGGNVYRLDPLNFLVGSKDLLVQTKDFELEVVDEKDSTVLELAHDPKLIEAYRVGEPSGLANSSGVLWQPGFFEWVVNTSWAHIRASRVALAEGGGVLVLANGGHHAEYERGFGFCPVNSLVITAKHLLDQGDLNKVAILDLDVHYGNGTHSLVKNDLRILSTDIWRYTLDNWTYTENSENIMHTRVEDKDHYFVELQRVLDKIAAFDPGIVFYHPGLDVLETDRMGGVSGFDRNALITREQMVGEFLRTRNIPFMISPGGSYVDHSVSEVAVQLQRDNISTIFSECVSALLNI